MQLSVAHFIIIKSRNVTRNLRVASKVVVNRRIAKKHNKMESRNIDISSDREDEYPTLTQQAVGQTRVVVKLMVFWQSMGL